MLFMEKTHPRNLKMPFKEYDIVFYDQHHCINPDFAT